MSISAFVRPDSVGNVEIYDDQVGVAHLTEVTDIDLTSFWLDVPDFGKWGALLDTEHGALEVAESIGESAVS